MGAMFTVAFIQANRLLNVTLYRYVGTSIGKTGCGCHLSKFQTSTMKFALDSTWRPPPHFFLSLFFLSPLSPSSKRTDPCCTILVRTVQYSILFRGGEICHFPLFNAPHTTTLFRTVFKLQLCKKTHLQNSSFSRDDEKKRRWKLLVARGACRPSSRSQTQGSWHPEEVTEQNQHLGHAKSYGRLAWTKSVIAIRTNFNACYY